MILQVLSFTLVQESWKMVEKRVRKRSWKFFPFSGADDVSGEGDGIFRQIWRNIPDAVDGICQNWRNIPNGISWRRPCAPHVPARGRRVWPCLGRRVGARAVEEIFSKNMVVILRLCRARWYIQLSILSNVWEVITRSWLCAFKLTFS